MYRSSTTVAVARVVSAMGSERNANGLVCRHAGGGAGTRKMSAGDFECNLCAGTRTAEDQWLLVEAELNNAGGGGD